jgi:RHS repeat-associated protein
VADTFNTYTYDPEGNITQINGGASGTYTYDERNDRVRIDAGGGAWEFLFGTNGERASFWDAVHGYEVQEQTYWGTTPLVFNEASYQQFQHQDWLGTERMRTTYSGAVDGSFVSLPYGDGYSVTGNDNDMYHFAGLDGSHAQFREYGSTQGRWMAPDPYSGSYDFSNPQSFNRYAYVMDNPLSITDPLGLAGLCGPDEEGYPEPCNWLLGGPSLGTWVGTGGSGPSRGALVNVGVYENPCDYQGHALPPSAYAAQGANAWKNPITLLMDKRGWPRGGFLDAQPMASGTVQQRRAYGNYVYGVYMQAAGVPLSLALYEANQYANDSGAGYNPQSDGPMDSKYTNIPAANVTNITNGFNAQANGTTCHQ